MATENEGLLIASKLREIMPADHVEIRNMIHIVRGQQMMLEPN